MRSFLLRLALLAAALCPALLAAAQAHGGEQRGAHDDRATHAAPVVWGLGAQAIGVVTRVSPALSGRDLTEGYVTQPALMGHLAAPRLGLALVGTLNLEGATLRRGELNTGIYGEGYVDRRHPHTYLHELVASVARPIGGARLSLSVGKGFAPFGTDDPMMRPFVKYPVNHHLAQILERVVGIGAVRAGPLLVEAGAFNGDEPVGPGDGPAWRRFGDSWSARTTLLPRPGVEVQGSVAHVASPELAAGGGTDQRKASASLRVARGGLRPGLARYALVEWARTTEYSSGRQSFSFVSTLAEGAVRWRAIDLSARVERTERPEEERLLDPFRSARPHTDASILGTTRWTIATAHLAREVEVPRPALRLVPFVEVSRLHAAEVTRPSAFVPAAFYGRDRLWNLSAGVLLGVGMPRADHRMGRYGVARPAHDGDAHDAGDRTHGMSEMHDDRR